MSATTITMHRYASGDLQEIANQLWKDLPDMAELIGIRTHGNADSRAILLSCEKYFFRNGSYASLNVMLTEFDGVQTADIVGSGGGEGLLNISFFANSDFAGGAEKVLKSYGFTTVEKTD